MGPHSQFGSADTDRRRDQSSSSPGVEQKPIGQHRYPEVVIDLRTLRGDPDAVRDAQKRRGESVELVDRVLAADEKRRASIVEYEQLRAEQKSMGKQIAKAQGDEKQSLLARTKELSEQVKTAEAA